MEWIIGSVILIWLVLAVVTGAIAEDDGRSGFFWFFVVLLTGILGIIFFLISKPSQTEQELEQRVSELEGDAEYCPQCGSELIESGCPDCEYSRQVQSDDDEEDVSDSTGSPFAKTALYTVVGVVSLFIGLLLWYGFASSLAPAPPLEASYYDLNRDIHRHIQDMGTIFTFSVTLFTLFLIRYVADGFSVTHSEISYMASLQVFVVFYLVSKTSVLLEIARTNLQLVTSFGILLSSVLIASWLILQAVPQRFIKQAVDFTQ